MMIAAPIALATIPQQLFSLTLFSVHLHSRGEYADFKLDYSGEFFRRFNGATASEPWKRRG